MITLIPSWAHHYEEFWNTIRARNLWLIKLRYGASAVLLTVLYSAEYLLGFRFQPAQEFAITAVTISIFIYNVVLHWLRRFIVYAPDKFDPLHMSIIQMLLDLAALVLIVYYSGTIESPLLMLFIFHMIIGSLILPGVVIYSIAVLIIVIVGTLIYLEYNGIIFHHSISGFLQFPLYLNYYYITPVFVIFAFVMIVSVLLANKIAKQLYKMEQELVESIDKLEKAEAEKQKYIIGVVHEIKTPISAVHSYLDLILQKFLGPVNSKIEERLYRAKMRSSEAIDMINNILKISRLRLLNEINKESVDLGEVLSPLIAGQDINIKRKNIELIYIDSRKIKYPVLGDSFMLELAFSNLIGNAIKYVNENGKIIIELSETDDEVQIMFSDNGIGIPGRDLEKIFQDFYRASNIKQKNYEGAGLGLSIVKKILESHNGTISVESPSPIGTPGKPGACFRVAIPVYRNLPEE